MSTAYQSQAAILNKDKKLVPVIKFLDSYNARLLGKVRIGVNEVQMYLVNARIVFVSVSNGGWDLFIPASDLNETDATLKAAENFLGPRPGDDSESGWRRF